MSNWKVSVLLLFWPLLGCVPRIEVATPKEPITINMNVKIEHEIRIKVDKDVEQLLKQRSDLFR
ncbi:MAG: YnbE family lipoprotein [Enterobacteriaceae bacterium]